MSADTLLYAVFRKGGTRTYVACNPRPSPRTVRFSDGARVEVPPGASGIGHGAAPLDE